MSGGRRSMCDASDVNVCRLRHECHGSHTSLSRRADMNVFRSGVNVRQARHRCEGAQTSMSTPSDMNIRIFFDGTNLLRALFGEPLEST